MNEIKPKWSYTNYLKTLPAVLVGIIIFYFSSLSNPYPTPPSEQIITTLNSFMHLCEFGLLSFLIFFGFFSKVKSIYLLTASFFYALLDEIHQFFVPYRYFDIYDLIIDSIGVVFGFLSYLLAKKLYMSLKRKHENSRI